MNNIKISVITISYNHVSFIEDTIKSIISQKGNFYLEYIIIDGGSTDGSVDVIKQYDFLISSKTIPIRCLGIEYKYISEKDKGPTHALNKGLKMLTGEIVGILNSDDIYTEGTFNKIVEAFQLNIEVEIVYGDVVFIDESKKIIGIHKGKRNLSINDFKNQTMLIQPEVFIKKSVLDKIGLFDESLAYANDYEFWLRALKNKIKFMYIPEKLVYFRKRNTARSSGIYPEVLWETLLVQYKYFHISKIFLKNLGEYAAYHSEKASIIFEKSFNIIKNGFLKSINNNNFFTRKDIKIAMAYGYIKKAIFNSFNNKKYAIRYLLKAIYYYPPVVFSKNGLVFSIKMFCQKEKIYYALKNLLWYKP